MTAYTQRATRNHDDNNAASTISQSHMRANHTACIENHLEKQEEPIDAPNEEGKKGRGARQADKAKSPGVGETHHIDLHLRSSPMQGGEEYWNDSSVLRLTRLHTVLLLALGL